MNQLSKKENRKSNPSGKPVKPQKPPPTKEEAVKIPVPCAVLTEERVREIAREEIIRYMGERAKKNLSLMWED